MSCSLLGANVGLALMIILDLFPGGVIQIWDSIANGYWHARRLTSLMGGTYHKLEWLLMVGDVAFLLAGALPITLGAVCSIEKGSLSHAVKAAFHRVHEVARSRTALRTLVLP